MTRKKQEDPVDSDSSSPSESTPDRPEPGMILALLKVDPDGSVSETEPSLFMQQLGFPKTKD